MRKGRDRFSDGAALLHGRQEGAPDLQLSRLQEAPRRLAELENEVDRILGTDRWVGNTGREESAPDVEAFEPPLSVPGVKTEDQYSRTRFLNRDIGRAHPVGPADRGRLANTVVSLLSDGMDFDATIGMKRSEPEEPNPLLTPQSRSQIRVMPKIPSLRAEGSTPGSHRPSRRVSWMAYRGVSRQSNRSTLPDGPSTNVPILIVATATPPSGVTCTALGASGSCR